MQILTRCRRGISRTIAKWLAEFLFDIEKYQSELYEAKESTKSKGREVENGYPLPINK